LRKHSKSKEKHLLDSPHCENPVLIDELLFKCWQPKSLFTNLSSNLYQKVVDYIIKQSQFTCVALHRTRVTFQQQQKEKKEFSIVQGSNINF